MFTGSIWDVTQGSQHLPEVATVNVTTCASQVVLVAKNPPANAGDTGDLGSIPESGRSLGGGPGKPLQYPCLEDPTDRGAWQATVHKVGKCWIRLRRLSTHAQYDHFIADEPEAPSPRARM